MFRALLADLLESKNEELESYLNELGVETEISAAEFVFRRKSDHSIKGVMLVSNFHPGPFQNIGSSVLPFQFHALIKKRLAAGIYGSWLLTQSSFARADSCSITVAIANLDMANSAENATSA